MKKINKDISIKLSFGIFSAIGFVAGILLIIFGAGKSAIMLTAGIILGINGFYGTPLWFISYGENKAIKRVVYAIEKEKIYSVKDIATQLQLPEKDVKEKVNKAIEKNYISGFLFDGETFKANNNTAKVKKLGKCENCGGTLAEKDGKLFCPYCNTVYEIEK